MTTKRFLIGGLVFCFAVILSLIWHFPASYVLSMPNLKQAFPQDIQLSQTQGVWWSGKTQVTWQKNALGQVTWTWQPFDLFTGQLAVRLAWQQAEDAVQVLIKTNGQQLSLEGLTGHVQLARLSNLNPALGLLADARGDVILKDLSLITPLQAPWPTHLAGQVVLVDLNAMGVQIQQGEITPSMQDNTLLLTTQAQNTGWSLTGKTLLNAPNRFTHDYQLRAENAQSMPDWTPLFMRQTSPTQAVLTGKGIW